MRKLVLAFISFTLPAFAQVTSSPGGDSLVTYTMQFQVLDQASEPVKNVLVDVLSFSGMKLMGAQTNGEGRVLFRIAPGTYTIAVRGNDIQDSQFDFRVERYDGDRIEQFTVKRKGGPAAPRAGGFVTAAMLSISPKAKEEFEKASAELAKKQYEKAKIHYAKAVAIYPRYAEAFNGLGIVALHTGKPEEARERFNAAIKADDQHPTAYLNLARMFIMEQNAPAALPLLKKSVALNPSDAEARSQLSFAQFATGDCPAAIATAQTVHAMPHRGAELAHFVAGTCYGSMDDRANAEADLNTYLKEAPTGQYAAKVRALLQELQTSR